MGWLADENIDRAIVDRMRGVELDITSAPKLAPSAPDDLVLARARAQDVGRVLLMSDKDFGELV